MSSGDYLDKTHPVQNPMFAIAFALDRVDDHYDRLDFLRTFYDGNLFSVLGTEDSEWDDYISFANRQQQRALSAER